MHPVGHGRHTALTIHRPRRRVPIDVLISRLRHRFDRDGDESIIRTVRGGGYQVAVQVQWL